MKWVTTPNVHYDRVASAWVIKRFIDPKAEFSFVAKGKEEMVPKDATAFAIVGAKIGPHDETGVTTQKLIKEYKLDGDPALVQLGQIVNSGVNYVLHAYRPPIDDRFGQIAVGYLAFADGMMLVKSSDQERLEASYPVWDALYALLKSGKKPR